MSIQIVACLQDDRTVTFAVKDNGRCIASDCATMAEAEEERDAYLAEMHAFNDGPFSAAQSRP